MVWDESIILRIHTGYSFRKQRIFQTQEHVEELKQRIMQVVIASIALEILKRHCGMASI